MPPEPVATLAAMFGVGSLAGLGWLLRSGKPITWRTVFSAVVNTGIMAACVVALLWRYMDGYPWAVIGAAGILSLGGVPIVDWVVSLAQRWITRREAQANGPVPHARAPDPGSHRP